MKRLFSKILLILILFITMITPVFAAASNNKYLKELEVENHKIYFGKERTQYKIVLDEGENSVKIKAVAEDSKSKVEIKGADDIKGNNYRIVVKVTAENNTTMEYVIEASVKEEIVKEEKKSILNDINQFFTDLNIDQTTIFIVLGVIFLVIGIVLMVVKAKDRKMDKTMDRF